MAELKNRLQCELTEQSAVQPSVRFQLHLTFECVRLFLFNKKLAARFHRVGGDYLICVVYLVFYVYLPVPIAYLIKVSYIFISNIIHFIYQSHTLHLWFIH